MSIHAQLSPEAQAALQAQKRNSTISSVAISVLTLVLIGLILGYILLPSLLKETPQIVTYTASVNDEENLDEKKVNNTVKRTPSAPSSSIAKVIAANTLSNVAVPVPDTDTPTPSTDFGDGDDFGSGWGSGDGDGGGGFGNIPTTMKKRCSKADRLDRLKETGGTQECEDAVVKGLQWLKSTQSKDGGWPGGTHNTGFALLAYLGHCETPISEEYGESCLRAITHLINLGQGNKAGWLVPAGQANPKANRQICYQHGINTYALAEATTFCKQLKLNVPKLEETCQKAGQLIIDNQTKEGGWEYGYAEISTRGGGDLSITAWQVQALKACKHTGLDFRNLKKCADRAVEYVKNLCGENGGFGYSGPGRGHTDYNTLTGAGVLCLQMWDQGSRSQARDGAKYIDKNTKFDYNTRFADLYGHYYEAQAMMNRGGEQWKRYNALFRDQVVKNQNADGSWKVPGGGAKDLRAVAPQYTGDVTYRSCLCILMLEVYYRFLPGTGSGSR
jgi:hypothetical protein